MALKYNKKSELDEKAIRFQEALGLISTRKGQGSVGAGKAKNNPNTKNK